jgi:hypothetical protein
MDREILDEDGTRCEKSPPQEREHDGSEKGNQKRRRKRRKRRRKKEWRCRSG